jgi:hypothetical protein
VTPAGYGDKKSIGESWDQVPRPNRGIAGRQARKQDREGRKRGLQMHGSNRKQQYGLRHGLQDARAGTFRFLGAHIGY